MRYQAYFIDLDGTLYHGTKAIPEAIDFMKELEQKGIPYLYVTNNSTKTPQQVAEHLHQLGFPADANKVYTSAMATAAYLQEEMSSPDVFVIGEYGLEQAVQEVGCRIVQEEAEAVVVGLDRDFHYDKLSIAVKAIRAGAKYIGTNADRVLPTEAGIFPGSGSINKAVEWSTGVEPLFIGKPEPIILRYAAKRLEVDLAEVLMIGDNMDTDILAGVKSGMETLLVLTGVTDQATLERYQIQPTYVVKSLSEWKFN
ncbi:TIGR01457 family HAD-type hydrolase [Risungbinella massiliensis]|uniref:TIGR01457 family HAD-type hydrolase n=1 Tax=Risungbinella massiliensis TaxID=1329796 RepID=UPI0005CBE3C6|nr:TIGR01457 family HAD-type hydrolase [Risungbinella massiliensis]